MADRAVYDANHNPTLLAVSTADHVTPVLITADPTTRAMSVIQAAADANRTLKFAAGQASASGNNTIVAAGTNKLKVYALALTTVSATAVIAKFQSGAGGTDLWRYSLQAPTSVSVGANLAVTPPAYLFATAAATLLNLNLSAAVAVDWAVAYFEEA